MHICNTFFELELASTTEKPLKDWLLCHPMVRKLQYLPLRYTHEKVLVATLPPNPDPRLHLLDDPPLEPLESWGASKAIALWAASHNIPYSMPPWDLVRQINSKVFSYLNSPQLPNSALLTSSEVKTWIAKTSGPKVLKTPQGFAGQGHFHLPGRNLDLFLSKHPILICEPWVNRILDFSTQWKISPDQISYLGATLLQNRPNGTYLSNILNPDFKEHRWALEEHLAIAKPLIQKIQQMGYFGHLGIDAFIYGDNQLHSIVEINARKTMGWVSILNNFI